MIRCWIASSHAAKRAFDGRTFARREFQEADLVYLREAYWMRRVGRRVLDQPASAGNRRSPKTGGNNARRNKGGELARAERLFDWTIRNIQLERLPPMPAEEAAGPGTGPSPSLIAGVGSAANERMPLPAAARGEPGPGYRHDPWQTLLLGHGDAWERARVFIALGRQQDLEIVMLATEDPQTNRPPSPWLPALFLDEKLYLFDALIGWPILARAKRGDVGAVAKRARSA